MRTDNQTVILFVKVVAKTESQQRAKDALLADVNGARTETGNFKMELYQVDNAENNFYLIERWRNKNDLETHFKQPYTQGAFDLQRADLTEPIEMNYLEDLWPLTNDLKKEVHHSLTTLIVPFEVKLGCAEKFIALFKQFVPLVRKEKGNVEFHFHRVIGSDTRFVLYERWEKQEDLNAHNQQGTTGVLLESVAPLLTKPVIDFVLFSRDIS